MKKIKKIREFEYDYFYFPTISIRSVAIFNGSFSLGSVQQSFYFKYLAELIVYANVGGEYFMHIQEK